MTDQPSTQERWRCSYCGRSDCRVPWHPGARPSLAADIIDDQPTTQEGNYNDVTIHGYPPIGHGSQDVEGGLEQHGQADKTVDMPPDTAAKGAGEAMNPPRLAEPAPPSTTQEAEKALEDAAGRCDRATSQLILAALRSLRTQQAETKRLLTNALNREKEAWDAVNSLQEAAAKDREEIERLKAEVEHWMDLAETPDDVLGA